MILLLDNYDSFAHNLARYLRRLGQTVEVVRNDKITVQEIAAKVASKEFEAIVISPGPGNPDSAGVCLEVVEKLFDQVPILGICLGHQAIVQSFGGKIIQWKRPIHGMADQVFHHGENVFRHLPSPFLVGRYHSLVADIETVPSELVVTARLSDQTIMAIAHNTFPVVGIQFHPESILTQFGPHLLEEFLKLAGLSNRNDEESKLLCDSIFSPQCRENLASSNNPIEKSRQELHSPYPSGCVPVSEKIVDAETGGL